MFRYWEATLRPEFKPRPEDPRPVKEAFIKAKYCDRAYLLPEAGEQARTIPGLPTELKVPPPEA